MENMRVFERLNEVCATENGLLTIVRMEHYFEFCEIYGEVVGRILRDECMNVISSITEDCDIKACLGGDEFVIFCKNLSSRQELTEMYFHMTKMINEVAEDLTDEKNPIYIGLSMGAVMVPEYGTDYADLFCKAEMVLDFIKEEGKHNIAFYDTIGTLETVDDVSENETDSQENAMVVDQANYDTIRDFLEKYISTYKNPACELIISIKPVNAYMSVSSYEKIVRSCEKIIAEALRKSDVMTITDDGIKILLPEISRGNVFGVLGRIGKKINDTKYGKLVELESATTMIGPDREVSSDMKFAI